MSKAVKQTIEIELLDDIKRTVKALLQMLGTGKRHAWYSRSERSLHAGFRILDRHRAPAALAPRGGMPVIAPANAIGFLERPSLFVV